MLVLRDEARDGSQVDLVENVKSLPIAEFERSLGDATVPELGTELLVRTAAALANDGYFVVEVDIRDESGFPLLSSEQLTDGILEALNSGDAEEATRVLRSSFARDVFVIGLQVRHENLQVELRHNGAVEIKAAAVPLFRDELRKVWGSWRLG